METKITGKKQMVEAILAGLDPADAATLSKVRVGQVLDAMVVATERSLKDHGKALVPGIGSMTVSLRPAKTMKNPRTGEPVEVPARNAVKVSLRKNIKDAVND